MSSNVGKDKYFPVLDRVLSQHVGSGAPHSFHLRKPLIKCSRLVMRQVHDEGKVYFGVNDREGLTKGEWAECW